MEQELILREVDAAPILSAAEIRHRVQTVQELMRDVMKDGTHYGQIPGVQKKSLWQPGAETLCLTFGIAIDVEPIEERISDEEVSFRVRATARSRDGRVLGTRDAFCSTREKKYRWRAPVHPKEFEATPEHMRRITWDKDGNEKLQVRTDPGDQIETILQMASKRAHVALTRQVTGCSDMFAQELEEDDEPEKAPVRQPTATAEDMTQLQPELPVEDSPTNAPAAVQIVACKKIKSGETDRGPWSLYLITDSRGGKFTTFSLSVFAAAQKVMAEKGWARIIADPPKEVGKDPQIVELVRVTERTA